MQLTGLRPDRREEYLRLHAAVWPEVEERLRASHLSNYSIFLHGDLLLAYFEYTGDDYEADMAAIAADPTTQRWWELTDPCQEPVAGAPAGAVWADAQPVWSLTEAEQHGAAPAGRGVG
jgi:L-rhamnose mutarotase